MAKYLTDCCSFRRKLEFQKDHSCFFSFILVVGGCLGWCCLGYSTHKHINPNKYPIFVSASRTRSQVTSVCWSSKDKRWCWMPTSRPTTWIRPTLTSPVNSTRSDVVQSITNVTVIFPSEVRIKWFILLWWRPRAAAVTVELQSLQSNSPCMSLSQNNNILAGDHSGSEDWLVTFCLSIGTRCELFFFFLMSGWMKIEGLLSASQMLKDLFFLRQPSFEIYPISSCIIIVSTHSPVLLFCCGGGVQCHGVCKEEKHLPRGQFSQSLR